MADVCNDNRFELIEEYKKKLIDSTNIETSEDEMKVLDSIMFRFWQMGWLDILRWYYNLADDIRHAWCSDCMNEQHLIDNSEPCYSCSIVNSNFKEKARSFSIMNRNFKFRGKAK